MTLLARHRAPGVLLAELVTMSPRKPKRPPLNLPPRGRNRFNQRELARAMRAVQRTGGGFRIEINRDTGNMQLIPDEATKDNGAAANPWDEVLTNAADENRTA
jgi:hypothetical protein